MKKTACWMLMWALAVPAARASANVEEDPSADPALLTWHDPVPWQFGLGYSRVSRPVDLEGTEVDLKADIVDAMVGVSPWPWLLIYGRAGASEGRLEGAMRIDPSAGAGGLLGARVNVWQIYEGVQATSWRVTLQLAGQYAYWTSEDDGDGDLEWGEALVMLPLDYHLTFARTSRNAYVGEFQSFHLFAGPAFSGIDGTWTRGNTERDFEEQESFGVVGGGELWLLENLAFGARFDWFEGTSGQLTVRYRF